MNFRNKFIIGTSILGLLSPAAIVSAQSSELTWQPRTVAEIASEIVMNEDNQASYTVKYGDTLSAISEAMEIEEGRLAEINDIEDVDLIFPETVLTAQYNAAQEVESLSIEAPTGEVQDFEIPADPAEEVTPVEPSAPVEETAPEETAAPETLVAPVDEWVEEESTEAVIPEETEVDPADAEPAPLAETEDLAPVEETTVEQPVETAQPLAEETIEEAPVTEEEVVEAPIAEEEIPAEETPVVADPVEEEIPAEAPVAEDVPVEAPVTDQAPAPEAPIEEAPAPEAPIEEAPAPEAPIEEAPAPAPAPEEAEVPEEVYEDIEQEEVITEEEIVYEEEPYVPEEDIMNDPSNAGLQPKAAVYKEEVSSQFGIDSFSNYRPGDPGDHGQGLAVDFMVPVGSQVGDDVANYSVNSMGNHDISYVIWEQQIYGDWNQQWTPMEDRGSTTANHYDHVHVSFNP